MHAQMQLEVEGGRESTRGLAKDPVTTLEIMYLKNAWTLLLHALQS